MRRLRLTDAPRQLFPGRLEAPDLAATRTQPLGDERGVSPASIARWSIATPGLCYAAALTHRSALDGIIVAQPRTGLRSWEIAHFFANQRGVSQAAQFLEACAGHSARQGAERLFLRTPLDSPIQAAAERAGFVPAHLEEVYGLDAPLRAGPGGARLRLRPVAPGDDHALFRLHNAAVPSPVRTATGLTQDQWRDSREGPAGHGRAYAWDIDGDVHGWLRLLHQRGTLTIDALLHPDDGRSAASLLGDAARLARDHERVFWPVASYQPILALALRHAGWRVDRHYAVLVRPLAKHAAEPVMMPARA